MSHLPRRRNPALAKTRGPLRIYRSGQPVELVRKGAATEQARQAVNDAHDSHGRQPYD